MLPSETAAAGSGGMGLYFANPPVRAGEIPARDGRVPVPRCGNFAAAPHNLFNRLGNPIGPAAPGGSDENFPAFGRKWDQRTFKLVGRLVGSEVLMTDAQAAVLDAAINWLAA